MVWPRLPNNDNDDEKNLSVQLMSVAAAYSQFFKMDIFENIKKEAVTNGYTEVVRYCQKYFNGENLDQIELWHKVLLACKDR